MNYVAVQKDAEALYDGLRSHPREKRRAAQTSFILAELSWATLLPNRFWATVMALCRLTAQGAFMPSS